MKKRIVAVLCVVSLSGMIIHGDTAQSEAVAAGMQTNAIKQAGSTVGIQSVTTGGGVTDSRLGMESGRIVGESVLGPISGPQRIKDHVTTGGTVGDPGLITVGGNGEVKVGTADYDSNKLDLGTGGIIPSSSAFAPEYKIERLPEKKW